MNKSLFLLASASLMMGAPMLHLSAVDKSSDTMTVTVSKEVVKSDADVAKAVKDAFKKDQTMSVFADKVDVKVDKGVVTLSGTVDSEKTKADFEARAKAVVGVDKVVNNIVVKKADVK